MKYTVLSLLFSVFLATAFGQQKTYNITAFGAIANGATNNAAFIQQAIDEASRNGGGTVVVPKGIFITGSIELRSGVELHLSNGAVIQGSSKRKDYDGVKRPSLIVAVKQHHISITGKGTIDGQGREVVKDIFKRLEEGTLTSKDWKTKRPEENTRTNLFYFEECSNIEITGITCKDASSWVTHYERCRNLTIDSIKLESTAYWNNDGIDIVDCKNVRITNSFINAADDAICLKSARRNDYCDSIYIDNCTLRSSANAFKIGTGSLGGFKNITVRNLTVYDTYRSAIAIETVDGGFLENVDIRNVRAKNTGNAIFIKSGHRNEDAVYSSIKNIFIKDVTVEVPLGKPDAGYEMEGPLLKYPKGIVPDGKKVISVSPWNHSSKDPTAIIYEHNVFPSAIGGLPNHPVKNVVLENISISYEGGASKQVNCFPLDSLHLITEAEKDYPEFSMFGELPSWGLFVRHVEGLQMKNIKLLLYKKDDFRTAMVFDDVNGLQLNGIHIPVKNALPVMVLKNVRDKSLQGIELGTKTGKEIRIL